MIIFIHIVIFSGATQDHMTAVFTWCCNWYNETITCSQFKYVTCT